MPLSVTRLWLLFLPLSLSDLIMALAGPIIAAGLSRLPHPEISLAAYGVAEGVAIMLESPIIMLLQAATALIRSRRSFGLLFRFMLGAIALLTLTTAAVAFTPLYALVFARLLGLPPAIVQAARPAFAFLLLWPAAIGWRRIYQGTLIVHRKAGAVGWASALRLVTVAALVAWGTRARWDGALVAGVALGVSVIVEALAVTALTVWFVRSRDWERLERQPERVDGMPALWAFYWPLLLTSVFVYFGKPLLSAGLARSADPAPSLAAWPVVWTTVLLLANATRMVQQLGLSLVTDADSYRRVAGFARQVAGVALGLLALLVWTPLAQAYLRRVVGLPPALVEVALPTFRLLVLLPAFVVSQNWLQSLLVRDGRTRAVNMAALTNVVLAQGLLYFGAPHWRGYGTTLAALSVLSGYLLEVGLLFWWSRYQVRALCSAPTGSAVNSLDQYGSPEVQSGSTSSAKSTGGSK